MTEPRKGKQVHLLDALQVERAQYVELLSKGDKSPGSLLGDRLPDGAALYLFVSKTGAKSWRFDHRFPKGGEKGMFLFMGARQPVGNPSDFLKGGK
jgi:hypothetical protein